MTLLNKRQKKTLSHKSKKAQKKADIAALRDEARAQVNQNVRQFCKKISFARTYGGNFAIDSKISPEEAQAALDNFQRLFPGLT